MNFFSKGFRFVKRKIAQLIYFFIRDSFDEFAGNSATLQNVQDLQRIISEETNNDRFEINQQGKDIGEVKNNINQQGKDIGEVKNVCNKNINDLDVRIGVGIEGINKKHSELAEFIEYSPKKMKLKTRLNEIPKIDYVEFENKYRGSEDLIKKRQSVFVEFFKNCNNVLDIGCGRGEFLELLHKENIYSTGIDIDSGMVKRCKEKGLNVIKADVFEFLEDLENDVLDGIFCSQVVEHLSFKEIQYFIYLLSQKVRPEGVALFETINPRCIKAMQNFYLDITHVQPVDL